MASFNFGNNSLTTSTPAKQTGFGNFSFGGNTTTPAFGANQTTPAFGASTGFGQPSATPAFGSTGFGTNTASTSAPTFGFGTQTTSSTGFGGVSQAPAFGSGFGGFGATPASSAPTFNAFGTGGFGGLNTTSSAAPLFGGFGNTTTTTGLGGFGAFGKPAAAPTFGSTFGQPQQQQQVPQQLNPDECFAQSIFNVSIFGDERDTVIAKWNYLQAMWGTGKAFYNQNAPPIDVTPQNYLCRFKAMGYSKLPGKDNKMGQVSLVFNKPVTQVKEQQPQIINQMNQILGNKPTLIVNVDSIVPLADNKSQLVIFVEEKSQISNETKKILATELCNFLNQPLAKSQVANMGVEQVIAMVLPDEDLLKEYLENAPKGIDPRMWKQAKHDNPDPKKFIPVPIIGFSELNWRIKCQEAETDIHYQYMSKLQKDIEELKQRHASTTAKMMEHRRKLADLSHRILKIIVKQEITRKLGVGMTPEEEILRSKLENMQVLVSAPTQFKGRLSELLSQMRMQRNQWHHAVGNGYTLDKDSSEEMKTFLTMEQKAIAFVMETVNKDLKSLKIITEGMNQMV
ncbi:putative nucleoporin Nup54 [Pseudolycoriella hygida]|uniref:Nucleoporin Nup54 n=1 Tax=Pseudolycoriella hygida TaxID=35572 RepID=A0A9Q0RX62_9DIPT|nr:putative nucleoporin Nup54 [Pseudolycoriella hygida]